MVRLQAHHSTDSQHPCSCIGRVSGIDVRRRKTFKRLTTGLIHVTEPSSDPSESDIKLPADSLDMPSRLRGLIIHFCYPGLGQEQ